MVKGTRLFLSFLFSRPPRARPLLVRRRRPTAPSAGSESTATPSAGAVVSALALARMALTALVREAEALQLAGRLWQ